MRNRRNAILAALLLVQLGLVALVMMSGKDKAAPQLAFFPGLESARVIGLNLTDDQNRGLSLAKKGDDWMLASEGGLPTDQQKIEKLVRKLATLKSDQLVARSRESHQRFLVGEKKFSSRLTLTLVDGAKKTIYLGSSPSYNSVHLRAEGADGVYLVKDFSPWELPIEPAAWWRSSYLDLSDDALREIRISNPAGNLTLVNGQDGHWQAAEAPAGKSFDRAKIQQLVDSVRHINLIEYLGAEAKEEYGLAKPQAIMVLLGKDQRQTTLSVGPADKEGNRVMKSSASLYYVRGSGLLLKPLLEANRDRLLKSD